MQSQKSLSLSLFFFFLFFFFFCFFFFVDFSSFFESSLPKELRPLEVWV